MWLYIGYFVDPKQTLKYCLGSMAVGAQYGAVSSITFNRDTTRLLVGHARGQVGYEEHAKQP